MLFLLPLPLVAVLLSSLVDGELTRLLVSAVVLALYFGAAIAMRHGMEQEITYLSRRFAARPPPPVKLLASIMATAGTLLSAWWLTGYSLLDAAGFAFGTLVGCVLFYGVDPRRHAGTAGVADRDAALVLAEAEDKILAIDQSNQAIRNRELSDQLSRITARARSILDQLQQKPAGITSSRKFLTSYLDGARDVAIGYASTHSKTSDEAMSEQFRDVLSRIESVFAEQHQRLIEEDVMDLDVQIEVLKTQLDREGIR